jgi:glycosyltransferase involved in cell wall biosynthesis
MYNCPLCTIPQREKLLYSDEYVYVVETKESKGHKVRLMCCTHRHTDQPTFEERVRVQTKLIETMDKIMGIKSWGLVDSTFCTIPEHFHMVACDTESVDPTEMEQFKTTPKVMFPITQKILIGIPARNEKKNIASVINGSKKYGDVLVVSNGSKDGTDIIARACGAKVLKFFWAGYGRALQEIFKYAKENNYDYLITIDGDGQHDPTEIPMFLDKIQHSDIVVGNRFATENDIPYHRMIVIQGINKVYGIGDTQCGFRAYNKFAINKINITADGMEASLDIINKAKEKSLNITDVPCKVTYNKPEIPTKFIYQGLTLIEIIFWGAVWNRPYTYLGIPTFILFLISIFTGLYTTGLYFETFKLNISMALICGLSFISFLMLGTITFIISMQRRLVKELNVK